MVNDATLIAYFLGGFLKPFVLAELHQDQAIQLRTENHMNEHQQNGNRDWTVSRIPHALVSKRNAGEEDDRNRTDSPHEEALNDSRCLLRHEIGSTAFEPDGQHAKASDCVVGRIEQPGARQVRVSTMNRCRQRQDGDKE